MPNHVDLEESKYRHLLSTNAEPRDLDIQEVQSIVEQKKSCLARLAAQIKETQATLDSLIELQELEQRSLSRFNTILSPIRRPPLEILLEIFLFTRDWMGRPTVPGHSGYGIVGPGPGRSPLVITHVCSEWRRVALSAPVLWATIHFRLEKRGAMRIQDPARDKLLQMWLGRAGKVHPLDFTLIAGTQRDNRTGVTLSWMQPYAHRIKRLSLQGAFSAFPTSPFDVLEELNLSEFVFRDDAQNHRVEPSAPFLRYFTFEGTVNNLPTCLAWRGLTHLKLTSSLADDTSGFLKILSQCVALVEFDATPYNILDFIESEDLDPVIPDNERIIMPHLETLSLNREGIWLLPYLTLPALTKLHISYEFWPKFTFNTFQSRSSFTLKLLSLRALEPGRDAPMDAAVFLGLIDKQSGLTEIRTFGALLVTRMLISSLKSCTHHGVPDLVPHLEYLEMEKAFPHHSHSSLSEMSTDSEILDMLAFRQPSKRPVILETTHRLGVRSFASREVPNVPRKNTGVPLPLSAQIRSIHIYF